MLPILNDSGLKTRKIQIFLSANEYTFFRDIAKKHEESAAFFVRQALKTYIQLYTQDQEKE